jgi:hypothetical protein
MPPRVFRLKAAANQLHSIMPPGGMIEPRYMDRFPVETSAVLFPVSASRVTVVGAISTRDNVFVNVVRSSLKYHEFEPSPSVKILKFELSKFTRARCA